MDLRKLKYYCQTKRCADREVFDPKEAIMVSLDDYGNKFPMKRMIAINNGRFIIDCGLLLFFGTPKNRKNTHFYDSKGKKIA